MYWPHGVPRVYAVNGPDIVYCSSDDHREPENTLLVTHESSPNDKDEIKGHCGQHGSPDNQPRESQTNSSPELGKSQWGDEAIKGICVSRSGLMFATISDSSIALWHTRVC